MLVIEYDSIKGEVVPDGYVRDWANGLVEEYKKDWADNLVEDPLHIIVGSVLMIDATRLLVAEKKLDHKEVVYRFKGHDLEVDKNGMLRMWPIGI